MRQETLAIIKRNFLTPVVLSIYTLVIILLVLHEYRDASFVSAVITINTIFAVIQEIRARRALRKLELMNAPHARLLQENGSFKQVLYDEVSTGDTIELLPGDEIPIDGTVLESHGLEVNESMLTGESAAIEKDKGDVVYAASAVVAGTATIHVSATGNDTKAGVMTQQLKRYSPQLTPLQQVLAKLITILTFFALCIMLAIYIVYWLDGYTANAIFKTITAAGISIIPEGLILASTLLLAFGSLKLAQIQVLPQKLSAIEGMALLKLLCTDKTGTLTSDVITFEGIELFDATADHNNAQHLLAAAAEGIGGGNATSDALITGLPAQGTSYEVIDILAFSSERKLSGIRLNYRDTTHTLFIGAPECVGQYAPLSSEQQSRLKTLAATGKRVLLVAQFSDQTSPLKKLKHGQAQPFGFIMLSNELRDGVADTIQYLQDNGVSIRVISGDNPDTVQFVATQAGIKNPQKIITGRELASIPEEDWDETVLGTTIFARVQPEQKERLIKTFKHRGLYTGMVGDGVNDALALKESDLGVAMYAGATASRRVSDLILLNNSFTALPIGMKLGNRIMQAIEIISVLFFHKIIYSVTVLTTTMVLGVRYPFEPRHNTFMNLFMVSMPTIMWTLFPPLPKHRVEPKMFWRDTLKPIIPIALLSGLCVFGVYIFAFDYLDLDQAAASTLTVIVSTIFGMNTVFIAGTLLGVVFNRAALIARFLYLLAGTSIIVIGFGSDVMRTFFDFSKLSSEHLLQTLPVALIVVIVIIFQHIIAKFAARKFHASRN